MSYLPIRDISHLQDWEKQGYFQEFAPALIICNNLNLLPFYTPPKVKSDAVVSEFKIRKINIKNGVKTVVSDDDLDTGWIFKKSGINSDAWYFLANNNYVNIESGMFDMYVKLDDDTEFITEPFCIPNINSILSNPFDFNNDFNNDFLIEDV